MAQTEVRLHPVAPPPVAGLGAMPGVAGQRGRLTADHQKSACDALVASHGPILPDGKLNPAAKLSNQYAATMAALSAKFRLCKSATTRAESAGLKNAMHAVARPWDSDPEIEQYFS